MKAFLLAAGYGTRLRPITDTVPKCMVPIHGQPLLGWWLDLLHRYGVTEVLVNTHYMPEPVRDFMAVYNRRGNGLTVYETYEPNLLGSGGTIRENRDFVGDGNEFFICYADDLTDANLTRFHRFHTDHGGLLSMALFRANVPEQCGIAELDETNRVTAFVEKPRRPGSNLANAGIYITDNRIFEYLDMDKPVLDFGKDVLPRLVGRMFGWHIEGYLIDIGTMENYGRANEEWPYDYNEDAATN